MYQPHNNTALNITLWPLQIDSFQERGIRNMSKTMTWYRYLYWCSGCTVTEVRFVKVIWRLILLLFDELEVFLSISIIYRVQIESQDAVQHTAERIRAFFINLVKTGGFVTFSVNGRAKIILTVAVVVFAYVFVCDLFRWNIPLQYFINYFQPLLRYKFSQGRFRFCW